LLALPEELRKAGYTTNTIEGLRRQIRTALRATGGAHGAAARPRASNIRR
jgi:hypothetical protein